MRCVTQKWSCCSRGFCLGGLLGVLVLLFIFLMREEKTQVGISERFPNCFRSKAEGLPETFLEKMTQFPWKEFKESAAKSDQVAVTNYRESLLVLLKDFIIKEPFVAPTPVNECYIPALPKEINCSAYPEAFGSSAARKEASKCGLAVMMAYEIDVLEVHLNELNDVVDVFFILESTLTHLNGRRKPLLWEAVKNQKRFLKFKQKIVHFIVDDVEMLSQGGMEGMWYGESQMMLKRWEKIQAWNTVTNYFLPDDVIGFADADEIASRMNVHLLRHCHLKGEKVIIGSWFPFGKLNQAFRVDHPVGNHPYALGDPTFWRYGDAEKHGTATKQKLWDHRATRWFRSRGHGEYYLLGGIHMTHHGYLPYLLAKKLSCSECEIHSTEQGLEELFIQWIKARDVFGWEVWAGDLYPENRKRTKPLHEIQNEISRIQYIPWFLGCNPERYPTWHGKHDNRTD